ncbi:MAG TPA: RNase P subunit [Nitrososphaera sp.]
MNKKKQKVKQIARDHIDVLVEHALHEKDDHLAAKQAREAKKIAMHLRIRLPYEIRQLYCKRCKAFIVPGRTARVRVGRAKTRAVRITCLKCDHTYRKILIWNKDL